MADVGSKVILIGTVNELAIMITIFRNNHYRTSITRTFKGSENFFRASDGFELSREVSIAKYVRGNEYSLTQQGIRVKKVRDNDV